ncbi:hypothetical protein ACWEOZ_32090 [Actinoplanes sp. NPDC004185]
MVNDDAWQTISPRLLSWADVDPARHPFDAGEALGAVRAVAPPVPPRPRWTPSGQLGREEAERWRNAVSHTLVDRYGRWACGWCWAGGEGDYDGGPVGSWCCVSDSIAGPEETLALVATALCEWRDWLERSPGSRRPRWSPWPTRPGTGLTPGRRTDPPRGATVCPPCCSRPGGRDTRRATTI